MAEFTTMAEHYREKILDLYYDKVQQREISRQLRVSQQLVQKVQQFSKRVSKRISYSQNHK